MAAVFKLFEAAASGLRLGCSGAGQGKISGVELRKRTRLVELGVIVLSSAAHGAIGATR